MEGDTELAVLMSMVALGKVLNLGQQKASPTKERRLELRAGALRTRSCEPTSLLVLRTEMVSFWVFFGGS